MSESTSGHIGLYAVVSTDQVQARRAELRGLRFKASGMVSAVVGKPESETQRAALRHDRIMGKALAACASVVPFRLGVVLESEAMLHRLLEANQKTLAHYLTRFQGRVEMALKARLPAQAGPPRQPPFSLERLHALAPAGGDRREGVKRIPTGYFFDGCYLIARQDIAAFWLAVEEIRQAFPDIPLLGSGPWAAYSFCDFTLQPAQGAQDTLQEQMESLCER